MCGTVIVEVPLRYPGKPIPVSGMSTMSRIEFEPGQVWINTKGYEVEILDVESIAEWGGTTFITYRYVDDHRETDNIYQRNVEVTSTWIPLQTG